MTELLPYYRLARRYAVPALFVMNKAEEQAVVDDYAAQLGDASRGNGVGEPHRLRRPARRRARSSRRRTRTSRRCARAIVAIARAGRRRAQPKGSRNRTADLFGRLQDQILAPLRDATAARPTGSIASLRAMEAPPAGVDVNPITRQLAAPPPAAQHPLPDGPRPRCIDRVRQVPGAARAAAAHDVGPADEGQGRRGRPDRRRRSMPRDVPDFQAALAEQFARRAEPHRRRRSAPAPPASGGSPTCAAAGHAAKLDPQQAGAIADDELARSAGWLEKRWNATPRDTALLQKMLKHLPGGEKLTQWSEAAPYLLTIVVATHHAFFGHVDLMIIGGYTLATWLTERLSNEVASRTRQTNRSIAERFERLAHEQITRRRVAGHARVGMDRRPQRRSEQSARDEARIEPRDSRSRRARWRAAWRTLGARSRARGETSTDCPTTRRRSHRAHRRGAAARARRTTRPCCATKRCSATATSVLPRRPDRREGSRQERAGQRAGRPADHRVDVLRPRHRDRRRVRAHVAGGGGRGAARPRSAGQVPRRHARHRRTCAAGAARPAGHRQPLRRPRRARPGGCCGTCCSPSGSSASRNTPTSSRRSSSPPSRRATTRRTSSSC